MTRDAKGFPRLSIFSRRSSAVNTLTASMLIALVFVLSACQGTTVTTSLSAATADVTSRPATTSSTESYPIKVYFSRFPDSENNFNAVFPVERTSPTIAVGTFAIQLLIAGPTPSERNKGYFSELNSVLTGPSSCSAPYATGGPDFTLTLNKKGSVDEQGTATLRFCRTIVSPGIGTDARIQAEINATLKQFSSIKKVVILNKDGHCFGDMSGQDRCLK